MVENKNKAVYDFVTKSSKVHSKLELKELIEDFLKVCADTVFNLQVWPTNHEILCTELVLASNCLITVSCHQGRNGRNHSDVERHKVEDLILHTVQRICQWICHQPPSQVPRISTRSKVDMINRQIMQIVSSLENPIIHFKGLAIMSQLLALFCFWFVYNKMSDGYEDEAFACLLRLRHLASGSVLKEKLWHFHGLLLCCPVHEDEDWDKVVPTVEDLVSLVFAVRQQPNNLSLEYQPWKWLYISLESQAMMKEKKYTQVMSRLHEALETDLDPEIKARILCLFADCYQKQGCHQLAIQTYRDALETDNKCSRVMWYLSSIYQILEKNDLELECLNLLINMLSDCAEEDNQKQKFTCSLDEIIWFAWSPIYNITLPMAMYTFAKRCFQLKRYKEAAEQYFSLVLKLQSQTIFPEFIDECQVHMDLREMLVEAAEALLMNGRLKDSLAVSNHLCSCLSVCDSLALSSELSKYWDPFDDNDDSPPFSSSPEFLPSSTSSDKHFSASGTRESTLHDLSINESMLGKEIKKLADLEESSQRSRKRKRSDNAKRTEEMDPKNKKFVLKARALLCKSDALVKTEGFTDQSVAGLSEALDMLLNHTCELRESTLDSSSHSPFLKRQRTSSDEANKLSSQKHQRPVNPSFNSDSNCWMSLTLSTALRMGKASLERQRFSSVINSCLLALQLEPDNTTALFLKTLALFQHRTTRKKSSTDWLHKRGINNLDDVKNLNKKLQEKEALEKSQGTLEDSRWWQIGEKDLITLDIQCLKYLLDGK